MLLLGPEDALGKPLSSGAAEQAYSFARGVASRAGGELSVEPPLGAEEAVRRFLAEA
jgi:hypothetical protein